MATFNFYNRVSSRKIISNSDIGSTTKLANDLMKVDDQVDEYNSSDLMDDIQELLAEETQLSEEMICQNIATQVEIYDELDRAIETYVDSAITPDSNGNFLHLSLREGLDEFRKQTVIDAHKRIFSLLGFTDHNVAWTTFYEWALFGRQTFLIEYETKTKEELELEKNKIREKIGVLEVRLKENKNTKEYKEKMLEKTKYVEKLSHITKTQREGILLKKDDKESIIVDIKKIKKINFLEVSKSLNRDTGETFYNYKNEIFSENEIIEIDYRKIKGKHIPLADRNVRYFKISYAHRILRSYNILKRMEVTTVAWTVLNAMYRQVTVIPVTTKVSSKAKEYISKVRNKYLDNFTMNNDGEVMLNGSSTFNYMKHITLGSRQGSQVDVSTTQWSGFDMSDMKMVEYFRKRFQEDTRLPKSRNDSDGRSGGLSIYKADGVPFDEVAFYNNMDRVLHQFSTIIKKPTMLLAAIKDRGLLMDDDFSSSIGYRWEAMNNFLEAKKAEEVSKKLSNIDQMLRFDGVFPIKWLFVNKFEVMTEEEWKKMENMKKKDNIEEGSIEQ